MDYTIDEREFRAFFESHKEEVIFDPVTGYSLATNCPVAVYLKAKGFENVVVDLTAYSLDEFNDWLPEFASLVSYEVSSNPRVYTGQDVLDILDRPSIMAKLRAVYRD